jgi:hypothetical protein
MRRRLAAATVLALAATGATATAAQAPKKITAKGVGEVRLGMTAAELREAGLIGRLRPGCELEGPNVRFARLRAPLTGTVEFTQTTPRRASFVHITGRRGASARGVRIGDRLADITAAYPKRKIIRATEEIFGFTRVKIPKNGGGRMDFAVRVRTGKITSIDVPRIKICD